MRNHTVKSLFFCAALAGCTPPSIPDTAPLLPVRTATFATGQIETSEDGLCFTRAQGPTETRIVEEQILVAPEVRDANGAITSAAVFRNVSGPRTTTVGTGDPFETLCPQLYTPQRVATLQRALKARQGYAGPITGVFDAPTRAAVQQFQVAGDGPDSPLLSVALAQQLGVVALSQDQF